MGTKAERDSPLVGPLSALLYQSILYAVHCGYQGAYRFDQLQKIDVEGVHPCTRPDLKNLLAAGKDEPVEFENR